MAIPSYLTALISGILAVAYSVATRKELRRGDLGAARKSSSRAILWNCITVAAGVVAQAITIYRSS